jgi:hypothetical protein
VARKGANRPIFEGNMPPKKMYPPNWRRYRRHNRNPVKSKLHGYLTVQYKLIKRNIDIYTVNRDKKFWLNLVIWGRFYDVIHGWQADFRNVT